MKLIIAGGRDMDISPELVAYLLGEFLKGKDRKIDQIVSGACGIDSEDSPDAHKFAKGVDGAGERWAVRNGVEVKRFHPYFNRFGRGGGPKRNGNMAQYADRLLLIWDGESRGSDSMKNKMLLEKKPVYEVILRRSNVPVP